MCQGWPQARPQPRPTPRPAWGTESVWLSWRTGAGGTADLTWQGRGWAAVSRRTRPRPRPRSSPGSSRPTRPGRREGGRRSGSVRLTETGQSGPGTGSRGVRLSAGTGASSPPRCLFATTSRGRHQRFGLDVSPLFNGRINSQPVYKIVVIGTWSTARRPETSFKTPVRSLPRESWGRKYVILLYD